MQAPIKALHLNTYLNIHYIYFFVNLCIPLIYLASI